MSRITFYNSVVVLVALICFVYSVVMAFGGHWQQANFFLLMALFVYLFFVYKGDIA
jgi:hypothetical protein